jgi:hypothetical protein
MKYEGDQVMMLARSSSNGKGQIDKNNTNGLEVKNRNLERWIQAPLDEGSLDGSSAKNG